MVCINCKYEHDSNFCPNCGERSEVPRITFKSIFSNGLSTITNMNKGFLFNVKHLCLNPNGIVNDFLKGKRKSIFNPMSFLIIALTVYLIVDAMIVVKANVSGNKINPKIYGVGYEAGRFMKLYLKYFWILSIIWLSVSTKLLFGKYNYAEHLAINSFVMGQSILVGLVSFVITKLNLLFNPFVYISIIWITYQTFKRKKRDLNAFFQSVGSTLLFFIQLVIIVVLIGILRS
ncbi:MAG TPA: hypothetical protein DCS93_13380 [Microscillaceae bacterium]|nr:hypothetical protein [Microscillaceae bacterium]